MQPYQKKSGGFFNPSTKRYNITLDCFSSPVKVVISGTVKGSTTADMVKSNTILQDPLKVKAFIELRLKVANLRQFWIQALQAYHHANLDIKVSTNMLAMQQTSHDLNSASKQYWEQGLLPMINNGVLNCMELADLALFTINKSNALKPGYVAAIANLNDSKVPEGLFYYKQFATLLNANQLSLLKNHDHAFAVIINQYTKEIEYVVDLWRQFVDGKPFIGTLNEFINLLNNNQDGQYVVSKISPLDFRVETLFGNQQNASGIEVNDNSNLAIVKK